MDLQRLRQQKEASDEVQDKLKGAQWSTLPSSAPTPTTSESDGAESDVVGVSGGIYWKPPTSTSSPVLAPPPPALPTMDDTEGSFLLAPHKVQSSSTPSAPEPSFPFLKDILPDDDDDDDDDEVVAIPNAMSPFEEDGAIFKVSSSVVDGSAGSVGMFDSIWGAPVASTPVLFGGPPQSSSYSHSVSPPFEEASPQSESTPGGCMAATPAYIPEPAPVQSNSVVAMFAQAPVVAHPKSATHSSPAALQQADAGEWQVSDAPSTTKPRHHHDPVFPTVSTRGVAPAAWIGPPPPATAMARKGGSLEHLRKLRQGIPEDSHYDDYPPPPAPSYHYPVSMMHPPPTHVAGIAGLDISPTLTSATPNGVGPAPLASLPPSSGYHHHHHSGVWAPPMPISSTFDGGSKGSNKLAPPQAAGTFPISNNRNSNNQSQTSMRKHPQTSGLDHVRVTVELEPTPADAVPESSIHAEALRTPSTTSAVLAHDCHYYAFPDNEELKELEESPEFKVTLEKNQMERVFLGQLPYTTSETLVQWIAYYFGDCARLFHVEKITKNTNHGKINSYYPNKSNPSSPTTPASPASPMEEVGGEAAPFPAKMPTGCFHAYVEKQEAHKLLVGLHKKILVDKDGLWCASFPGSVDETMHPTFPHQVAEAEKNPHDKLGLSMLTALRTHCLDLKHNRMKRAPMMPYGLAVCQMATSNYDPESYRPPQKVEDQQHRHQQHYHQATGAMHMNAARNNNHHRAAPMYSPQTRRQNNHSNTNNAVMAKPQQQDYRPAGTSWAQAAKGEANRSAVSGGAPPTCVDF